MATEAQPPGHSRPLLEGNALLLQAMHEIAAEPDLDLPERIRKLLELGRRQFGMRFGVVTSADGESLRLLYVSGQTEHVYEGAVMKTCNTFCNEVLKGVEPLGIADASATPPWDEHAGYTVTGLRAYLGCPLRIHKRAWGTLCFFDPDPHPGPIEEAEYELLAMIASRIELGMEHDHVLQRFRAVAETTAGVTGEEAFDSMVEHLAQAFEADMTFVAECTHEKGSIARTLAVWEDGEQAPPFEYETANTPCEGYQAGEVRHFPENVRAAFPDDPDLAKHGIEGYVGMPVVARSGRVLGHMVAVRRKRLELDEHDRWLLQIFAARAATELERLLAEAEQARLEREVFHAEKMRGLGVLAGGIAHDFNNLLMGVLGNVDLALEHSGEEGELSPRLRRIRTAAVRAEELTKQMLVYAGHGPLKAEPMCLSESVQEIPDLLGSAVGKDASIEGSYSQDPLPMDGDASQVRQVVMNLVMNASDALGSRPGSIKLRTGRAELSALQLERLSLRGAASPGEYVFVEVLDDGPGMDEETRQRMFDPFFSTKFTGRGMGLSTVQGIVRRHGGGIEVESGIGHGTRVRVLFPASLEAEGQQDSQGSVNQVQEGLRKTILIVEDEDGVREVMREMLSAREMKVVTARSGEEALDALESFPGHVDLALVDLTMPGMNGDELARHIHERDATIPIVLMSGFDESATAAKRHAEHGVVAFIQKPFDFGVLIDKLHEISATHGSSKA